MEKSRIYFWVLFFLCGFFLAGFILASPPIWQGTDVNYTMDEDTIYYHDLRENITGFNNDVTFDFDSENEIVWTNASGTFNVSAAFVSKWMNITNSTTGNLTINATYDNQTGFFKLPIQASNTSGGATVEFLEFILNATNDFPVFVTNQSLYNLTQDTAFSEYFNATDEEQHYPLFFNLTFVNKKHFVDLAVSEYLKKEEENGKE